MEIKIDPKELQLLLTGSLAELLNEGPLSELVQKTADQLVLLQAYGTGPKMVDKMVLPSFISLDFTGPGPETIRSLFNATGVSYQEADRAQMAHGGSWELYFSQPVNSTALLTNLDLGFYQTSEPRTAFDYSLVSGVQRVLTIGEMPFTWGNSGGRNLSSLTDYCIQQVEEENPGSFRFISNGSVYGAESNPITMKRE